MRSRALMVFIGIVLVFGAQPVETAAQSQPSSGGDAALRRVAQRPTNFWGPCQDIAAKACYLKTPYDPSLVGRNNGRDYVPPQCDGQQVTDSQKAAIKAAYD